MFVARVTTYYAASMGFGFVVVVTNYHCEVGSILCSLLGLQLTTLPVWDLGL